MFSIGEKVVYGASGVMCIVDIREEAIANVTRRYFVLSSVGTGSPSQTFVPVDNESLVALMRPLLTRAELDAVLAQVSKTADVDWCADNRRRTECFKKILESGDRLQMLAMIRTIYRAGLARESLGKKNYLSDETVMKRAERLLASELSVVLDIDEKEARDIIWNKIL